MAECQTTPYTRRVALCKTPIDSVRFTPLSDDAALKAILDPSRFVRWIYTARLSLATAIFLAAIFAWRDAAASNTLIASLAFAASAAVTAVSVWESVVQRRRLGATFFYLQSVFDLLLVTAVVRITGHSASPFAALYILVIAVASLFLPTGGGLLIAALGCVLFFADAISAREAVYDIALWLQLGIFGIVALGSGWVAAKLREGALGRDELAAELVQARLEAADILHNIRSGIVTVDTTGRLLYANPAASDLLGSDLEARIGSQFISWVEGVSPVLANALRRSVGAREKTTRAEGFIDRGDERVTIGVTTTAPEAPSGTNDRRPATTTAIFQDISVTKRVESLRVRAQRLEAVAELSASLAHEIRNPLASIRSAVEQLSSTRVATEDERVLGALVLRESDRLSRLLGEFLDFARVRATIIRRVDIGRIARGATDLAGAHPDRGEGVVVRCTAPTEALIIEGDEDLLHRAIFNLVLNGVQATPERGRVEVDVSTLPQDEVPVGTGFDSGAVSLRVRDTGIGIEPDLRERMFDPFFTTKPGGSGLGLAVVHRAIEAHRGLVLVDSGSHGTCFTVLLPFAQSGQEEAP
jgi:two-component system sensor histidine kinase PilS (NtrC family)